MRYIRKASTALLGGFVLLFTNCSDNREHRIDTDNHFEYDEHVKQKITDTALQKSEDITPKNEKVLNLVENSQIEEVILVKDTSEQERDEAIRVSLGIKKKYDELNNKISDLNKKNTLSNSALTEANRLLDADKEKMASILKEKEEAIKITLKMRDEIKALEDKNREILIKYKELNSTSSDYKEEITKLQAKIEELSSSSNKLSQAQESYKKEIEELNNTNSNYKEKVAELESQIGELNSSLKEAQSQKTDIKTKLAASAAALLAAQQLTASKDDNISKVLEDKRNLEEKNGELENKIVALDTKIEELLKNEQELKTSYEEKLQESQTELEKLKEKINASLQSCKEENEKAKEEISNELIILKEKLAYKDNNLSQMEDNYKKEIEELNSTNSSYKEKIVELETKVEELSSSSSQFSQTQEEYKKEIEELNNTNSNYKERVAELESQIGELKSSLEEVQNQKTDIKTKLAASADALLAAQQLTASKDDNLTNIINERDEAIKVSLAMKKESQDKDAKIEELNQNIEKLTKELEKTKSLISEDSAKFDDLNQSITKLNSELQETKEQLSQKDKELQEKKTELEEEKSKVAELSKAKDESKSKFATKVAALLQAQKQISSKNDEINRLNDEIKNQKQNCQEIEEQLNKKVVLSEILNTFKLSKVEFKINSDVLTKKSTKLLDRVAEIMKEHPEYKYRIQGHTDSLGNEEHNLKLSMDRAKSVQDYLINQGIDAATLSYEGFGSSQPIADNATKEGRLANRRVVFEIEK